MEYSSYTGICHFDILCIQETWLTERCSLNIDGYSIYRSDRKKNKKKNNCGSGGVIILAKNEITKGISKINSKCSDFIWICLSKKHFQLENFSGQWVVFKMQGPPHYKGTDLKTVAIISGFLNISTSC